MPKVRVRDATTWGAKTSPDASWPPPLAVDVVAADKPTASASALSAYLLNPGGLCRDV